MAPSTARSDADATLAELGWGDMLAAEPDDAIAIVFEALGRTNATATAHRRRRPARARGGHRARAYAVVIPVVVRPDDGHHGPRHVAGAVGDRTCSSVRDGGVGLAPVAGADIRPVGGIDPDAGMFRVGIDDDDLVDAPDRRSRRRPRSQSRWHARSPTRSPARAGPCSTSRATTHSSACSSAARWRSSRRSGTGSPTRSSRSRRWTPRSPPPPTEPGELTAALAKATAGRTARTVGTHCQQVLAGVGFTTEHPFHRFLKRTMLLDALFGSADDLVVAIGHELLADRSVPTLVEL